MIFALLFFFPAFDKDGYPLQKLGFPEHPRSYFVGLPFMHTTKSRFLAGVGDDAAHVAEHIDSHTLHNLRVQSLLSKSAYRTVTY